MQAVLLLADGSVWRGESVGATGEVVGEVVFNTSMTGYQEIITDPATYGQIVSLTFPLIGNYGVSQDNVSGSRPYARGLVVGEMSSAPSHWRSTGRLDEYMAGSGVVGISGVDTRALTRLIRQEGTMTGAIASGDVDLEALLQRIRLEPDSDEQDLVERISTPEPYMLRDGAGGHVVIVDLGSTRAASEALSRVDCRVTVVPSHSSAAEIMAMHPAGVILSDGPGDPKQAQRAVAAVRQLLGQVSLLGTGLGHLVLALGLGADTYKLKFGHRGANHPVQDVESGRVCITSQNHGFAVASDKLPSDLVVTHRHLNDSSVEGLRHRGLHAVGVQFDQRVSRESRYLLDRFLEDMRQSA